MGTRVIYACETGKEREMQMASHNAEWRVYLSGEIHTGWREEIAAGVKTAGLPVRLDAPVTHHEASDDCGVTILGEDPNKFWHDHKGAKVNAIRTRTLIEKADIVVVRFGEKYRQWNAAFDAGMAAALGKPLIVMHQDEHAHALKEVDGAALAVCRTSNEVVDILRYVINAELDGYTA
jgi:YtoQ family protein